MSDSYEGGAGFPARRTHKTFGNCYNTYATYDTGSLTSALSCGEDITDRKRTEEALQRAERLGAAEDLAAVVAHHFNNMLQVVLGST